jgi:hypothetical protein
LYPKIDILITVSPSKVIRYLLNQFNIVLMVDKIPTSRDVLGMQAAASRCASLITLKLDELVLDERDPLSFLLHDLVHAYKMFSDTKLLEGNLNSLRCYHL